MHIARLRVKSYGSFSMPVSALYNLVWTEQLSQDFWPELNFRKHPWDQTGVFYSVLR
jgi:hypothetical protein